MAVEQAPESWWDAVRRVLRQLSHQLGSPPISQPSLGGTGQDHRDPDRPHRDPGDADRAGAEPASGQQPAAGSLDQTCPQPTRPAYRARALCIDGTSATVLLCDPTGQPLGPALMYYDARAALEAQQIAALAPADSPARGSSASLAKVLHLRNRLARNRPALALHQADWLSGRLLGRFGDSDWNNALKLGFDPQQLAWAPWLDGLDLHPVQLPSCHPPGADLGRIDPGIAAETGLPPGLRICAGTTDSTAASLATGACEPGDAVTSLGSTLVLKVLSEQPVTDTRSGVYSHRVGERWLVGGASNSGGAVLKHYFSDDELRRLSAQIDPSVETGLDYYPLLRPGERFPIPDPSYPPRLEPRPSDDSLFLAGLFEGIARIEQTGYDRLRELGAPRQTRILSIGGGAKNPTWTAIRSRVLGLPVEAAPQQEAAYGAALLARGH